MFLVQLDPVAIERLFSIRPLFHPDFLLRFDLDGVFGTLNWDRLKSWQNAMSGKEYPIPFKSIDEALKPGDVIPVKLMDYDPQDQFFRLNLYQEPQVNGAVLGMQPETGQVLAMIGGYEYEDSEFNRAIQAKRQPGSAFKPLVYASAVDALQKAASFFYKSSKQESAQTVQ